MKNNSLDSIAMQWIKITNKEITESYNNGKIVNFNDIDDLEILRQSKSIFVMLSRKTKNPSKIDQLIEAFNDFKTEMKDFKKEMNDFKTEMSDFKTTVTDRLDKINTRLTKVESLQAKDHKLLASIIHLNNLKTQ